MTFKTTPSPNNPSNSYVFVQALFTLGLGAVGLLVGIWLRSSGILEGAINIAYMALLGLLVGYLLGSPIARWWEGAWQRWLRWLGGVPPGAVVAGGFGMIVALIITVLLNSILEDIPFFTWYWSLVITLVLTVSAMYFFIRNREIFSGNTLMPGLPPLPLRDGQQHTLKDKVIDTSALIDGRICDIAQSHFVQGRILVPQMVLSELQNIADSSDPLRRKKGRRGLEMLSSLQEQQVLDVRIIPDAPLAAPGSAGLTPETTETLLDTRVPVDERLVLLCQTLDADLITTDYNLGRVASLQGVCVLNVNQLANMLRAVLLPGEQLTLQLVSAGREPGQALAYLEDGTMIVVEHAAEKIGQQVEVQVTSSLQTNVGRMIFARLGDAADK